MSECCKSECAECTHERNNSAGALSDVDYACMAVQVCAQSCSY